MRKHRLLNLSRSVVRTTSVAHSVLPARDLGSLHCRYLDLTLDSMEDSDDRRSNLYRNGASMDGPIAGRAEDIALGRRGHTSALRARFQEG